MDELRSFFEEMRGKHQFFSGKLFQLLINEISSDSKYKYLVDTLLMDYVPYAKQMAYKDLVWRRLEEEGYASD